MGISPAIRSKTSEKLDEWYRDSFVKEDHFAFLIWREDTLGNPRVLHEYQTQVRELEQKLPWTCNVGDDLKVEIAVLLCRFEIEEKWSKSVNNLKDLISKLRELKGIFFVGAGVSFEADLGWVITDEALFSCFEGTPREDLAKKGKIDRGHELWLELRRRGEVFDFQQRFCEAVKAKEPEYPHHYLVELIKLGKVEHLVCFNWDNLIETAYQRVHGHLPPVVYGSEKPRNEDWFWKPHWCVTKPNEEWVLPCDSVVLNPYFAEGAKKKYKKEKKSLIVVVCIGFSGSELFTKEHIRELFGSYIALYDVRPHIEEGREFGETIYFSASKALNEIFQGVEPRPAPLTL